MSSREHLVILCRHRPRSANGAAWLVIAIGVLLSVAVGAKPLAASTIAWVTVGDAGNAADNTGYGAVDHDYRIMRFEWTNAQYVDYLNAIDPDGTNPNSVYSSLMGSNAYGGIVNNGSTSGAYYSVRPDMADKPVNLMTWFRAARVANWMNNGAHSYGSSDASATAPQNVGAYTLGTATSGTAPAKNANASFYIPSENEWYKAAYYKGGGMNAGYWDYATGSDIAPTPVTASATGVGSAGSTGNYANYNHIAVWNGHAGNLTTVGTNGGSSAYGTLDQGGNVWEWNDLAGLAGTTKGRRGGNMDNTSTFLQSSFRVAFAPDSEGETDGFRLASTLAAAVPEIDPAGLGSVAGLLIGAFGLLERRRAKVAKHGPAILNPTRGEQASRRACCPKFIWAVATH